MPSLKFGNKIYLVFYDTAVASVSQLSSLNSNGYILVLLQSFTKHLETSLKN